MSEGVGLRFEEYAALVEAGKIVRRLDFAFHNELCGEQPPERKFAQRQIPDLQSGRLVQLERRLSSVEPVGFTTVLPEFSGREYAGYHSFMLSYIGRVGIEGEGYVFYRIAQPSLDYDLGLIVCHNTTAGPGPSILNRSSLYGLADTLSFGAGIDP